MASYWGPARDRKAERQRERQRGPVPAEASLACRVGAGADLRAADTLCGMRSAPVRGLARGLAWEAPPGRARCPGAAGAGPLRRARQARAPSRRARRLPQRRTALGPDRRRMALLTA